MNKDNVQFTTQHLQDPDTKEEYVGLFARITTTVINSEGVPTQKDIPVATRLDAVPGLSKIIEDFVSSAKELYRTEVKEGRATYVLAEDVKNVVKKKTTKKADKSKE